ncbi:MAG: hypothetical protein ACT4QG_12575 [Sporichthyaceae bacterium]
MPAKLRKAPAVGSTVRVRFGLGTKKATVLETSNGYVRVAIHLRGVADPIHGSYPLDEVQPA